MAEVRVVFEGATICLTPHLSVSPKVVQTFRSEQLVGDSVVSTEGSAPMLVVDEVSPTLVAENEA